PPRYGNEFCVPAVRPVAYYLVKPALTILSAQALLASAAPQPRVHDDLHPLLNLLLVGRDLLHDSRDVRPGDVRKGDLNVWEAYPRPEVEAVESAGFHPDEDLVRCGHRVWGIFIPEHLGSPVLMEPNCSHGTPSHHIR